jgi:hypothetical protein
MPLPGQPNDHSNVAPQPSQHTDGQDALKSPEGGEAGQQRRETVKETAMKPATASRTSPSPSAKQQQAQSGEGQQYGEGNYKATRQYNEGMKEHVQNHDIEQRSARCRAAHRRRGEGNEGSRAHRPQQVEGRGRLARRPDETGRTGQASRAAPAGPGDRRA